MIDGLSSRPFHGCAFTAPRRLGLPEQMFGSKQQVPNGDVIEHVARIRVQLPTSCPEVALFRSVALNLMPSGP